MDHVTKITRVGGVTRRIKDNQLELVFEGGKLVIPPLIHGRAGVWALVNAMPAEVRDDGVTRANRVPTAGQSQSRAQEDLMAFLNSLGGPRSPDRTSPGE